MKIIASGHYGVIPTEMRSFDEITEACCKQNELGEANLSNTKKNVR